MRFEECAATYDTYAKPQQFFAQRVADFLQAPPGSRILELGAGTGALTRHFQSRPDVSVRASDVSAAMVAVGEAAVPNAGWFALDAFNGSIPSSSRQISSGLLQWAPDPVETLRRWKSALEPDGRMVHAFPAEPCLQEWRRFLPEGPVRWRDESDWLRVFDSAGLVVLRHALWVDRFQFNSALEMVRAMHRSGVTGRVRVGPGTLRSAMRAYEARYREGETVAATWAWMAVEARPLADENILRERA